MNELQARLVFTIGVADAQQNKYHFWPHGLSVYYFESTIDPPPRSLFLILCVWQLRLKNIKFACPTELNTYGSDIPLLASCTRQIL